MPPVWGLCFILQVLGTFQRILDKVEPCEQIYFTIVGGLNYGISIEQRFVHFLIMF